MKTSSAQTLSQAPHSPYYSPERIAETVAVLKRSLQLAQSIGNAHKLKTNVSGLPEVVTEADPACQDAISTELRLGVEPGPACIGEEGAREQRLPADYDALDPVDGTLSFARGVPRWGVLLGSIRASMPVAGVALLLEGNVGFSVDAQAGDARLWDYGRTLSQGLVRPTSIPPRMLYTPGYYSEQTNDAVRLAAEKLGMEAIPAASAVHASLLLAQGKAAGFLCNGGKVWDQAPLAALLQLWGGGEVDIGTLQARDWSSISGRIVQGFDLRLLKEFARALQEVAFVGLAPEEQWVPDLAL